MHQPYKLRSDERAGSTESYRKLLGGRGVLIAT